MWAMFGVATAPLDGVSLRGLSKDSVTIWQYAGVTDTVLYARTAGDPVRFYAEARRAGELIGRAETTLKPNGAPIKGRLTVPSEPARLDLTFLSTTRTTFAPDIWVPRLP
jgi:hypothetical protein